MSDYIADRVGGKKVVSQPRCPISWSPFFWKKIYVPNLLQCPESRVTKLRVYKIPEAVNEKRTP